jgi:hypothetical protein
MAHGIWKDEQRGPGPWPQGRRRPLAIVAAVIAFVVADLALHRIHSNVVLGGIVVLISLTGFYTAARLDRTRLEQQRYTRGPGWLIGLTISRLPLGIARIVWLALSTGILALGVVAIVQG